MRNIALLLAVTGVTLAGYCQVSPDAQTTLLCHFDRGLKADYSAGDWTGSAGSDVVIEEGKFGGAAHSTGRGITFPAGGNLSLSAGTIEVWLQPLWRAQGDVNAGVFTFRTDTGDYLNLNVVYGKRLGVAVRTGGEDWTWKRVDLDITGWDPLVWRHIAATWGNGELHFFVDGAEVGEAQTDLPDFTGSAESFALGAGDMRLDALRLSDIARTPADIEQAASAEPRPPAVYALSDLPLKGTGEYCTDGMPDRAHLKLPLIAGDTVFARGIGMRGAAQVSIELPEGCETLTGTVGASALNAQDDAVALEIQGDGKSLWSTQSGKPEQCAVSVEGVRTLSLIATPANAGALPYSVWGDLRLLREGASAPRAFSREATEVDLKLGRLRRDSERFSFELPKDDKPYHLFAKSPLDTLDPAVVPGAMDPTELKVFAAANEYEPIGFVIAAREHLAGVSVTATSLKCEAGEIPPENVDVRWVLRGPQRLGYWMERDQTEVTSRFLMPSEPFDLAAGNLREMFLDIHVEPGTAPGIYEGSVVVAAEGAEARTLRVSLRVLPIELPETQRHRYGMYYHMRNALADPERGRLELADMEAHGVTTLWGGFGVRFFKDGDEVKFDCDEIRQSYEIMREAGYAGTVAVHDNVAQLARLLGHSVAGKENLTEEGLEDDPQVLSFAREAFDEVKRVDAEYPEFRTVLTHMDEVFNNSRLPLYIQLAKIVRATTDLPLYITHHTSPNSRWEEMMAESDAFVDIRCMNGHALDDWLRAGHTFEELAEQGRASGDELWTYYNMRGSFFTPEWCRIVNGYYMWLSPLTVHIPWMYYSFGGDPFDDTDADHYDFAYSAPSAEDGITPVPTLHMKGSREGIDDMRYLEMLEDLIARANQRDAALGDEAEDALARLRSLMPGIPSDITDIEGESPVLIWISQQYGGDDYQRLRYVLADQIMRLQEALK